MEAELHVLGGDGIAVVEAETLTQLELIDEPVRAFFPGLGHARGHIIAGQRLDQCIVQGVEEDERRADPRGLGGVEEGGGDRGVEGNGQLSIRLALGGGLLD